MIIDEEFHDYKNGTNYCSLSFNRNTMVRFGDDDFYKFVGKQMGIKLTELIHPDYMDEFLGVVENIKNGETIRLITMIKSWDELYHMMNCKISSSGKILDQEEMIDMELWNVFSIEHRFNEIYNASRKYKTLLAMYHDYIFDYDTTTDILSLYYYDSIKPTMLAKGPFADVREKIVKLFIEMDSNSTINDFFDGLLNETESGNYEFDGPDVLDRNHRVHYYVNTRTVYKADHTKIITGIIRANDKEASIAFYDKPEGKDFFTGLYNKRACEELVNDTLQSDKNLHYMVVMDVDNFKNVNDRYGHLCGDQVILKMGEIINKAVAGRGIVGRFGGDEFFVFTKSIDSEGDLRAMLTFIKKLMRQEFQEQFGGDGLTASMGVSCFPDFGKDYDTLFKEADKCLYIAKEKGKNRFIIYDPEKHGDLSEDSESMEMGITGGSQRSADIAEDVGQLILKLANTSWGLGVAIREAQRVLGIDGIRVYVKSLNELLTHTGDYRDISELEKLIFTEKYDKLFDGKDYVGAGLIGNIEMLDKDIYKANVDAGIGGYYACKHRTRFGDEIRVFYDNIGRKMNLTNADIELIRVLTAVFAGTLEL